MATFGGVNTIYAFIDKTNMFPTTLIQVFGDVWAAPLTSVVHENIRGEVEKEIQEKEWTLKEQKKPKRGRAVKATAESSAADAIEVDDEVWSIPSDTDLQGPVKKPKPSESDDGKGERKAVQDQCIAYIGISMLFALSGFKFKSFLAETWYLYM